MKTFKFFIKEDIVQLKNITKNLFKNEEIKKIDFFNYGRINYIYLITLINEKKFILKIQYMLNNKFSQGFGKEKELLKIYEIKKYIPKIYYIGNFGKRKFSIMEYIIGEEVCLKDTKEIFFNVGKILRKIHEETGEKINRNKIKKIYKNYLILYIKKIENIKEKFFLLRYTKKLLKDSSLKYKFKCILHHDFHLKNIINDKKNGLKIIDWDSSRVGIDEIDFVKFKHLNFLKMNNIQRKYFIYGYTYEKKINVTPLIIIVEILWLIRMEKFENSMKENKDEDYFPNANYYKKKKEKLIQKLKEEKKLELKNLEEYFYF